MVPGARAHPYHAVLVVDFDDNDGGVVPQLMSFAIELQVVEHQHLVPGGAQGLIQHLQHGGGAQVSDGGWATPEEESPPVTVVSRGRGSTSAMSPDSSGNLKMKADVRSAPDPLSQPPANVFPVFCVAWACSYLPGFPLRIWGTGWSVSPGPRGSQPPSSALKARAAPSSPGPSPLCTDSG